MHRENAQSLSPVNHVQPTLSMAFCLVYRPCHRTALQCNRHHRGVKWR
jgi:hypothetical protein